MHAAPTRTRYLTIAFAMLLAIITYIDRVCISQAAPLITQDLGLSKVQMAWAFSVFGWAYALFEIPGGWLADRLGPRRVLMRIVIWWSFFTAATGWAWNLTSLLVTRTLFGMGEAGCFPNLTRIFTMWLPQHERERAQANLWLAARWGGAFTPLLVTYVLDFVTWRRAFELFGLLGVVWAIGFYRWFRESADPPEGERRRTCAHAAGARECDRARPDAVGSPDLERVGVAPRRAVHRSLLRLVFLRDLAADVPAGSPRHQRQDGRGACRTAAAAWGRRLPDLGMDHPEACAEGWQRRTGTSNRCGHRIRWGVGVDLHLHENRRPDPGHADAWGGGPVQ